MSIESRFPTPQLTPVTDAVERAHAFEAVELVISTAANTDYALAALDGEQFLHVDTYVRVLSGSNRYVATLGRVSLASPHYDVIEPNNERRVTVGNDGLLSTTEELTAIVDAIDTGNRPGEYSQSFVKSLQPKDFGDVASVYMSLTRVSRHGMPFPVTTVDMRYVRTYGDGMEAIMQCSRARMNANTGEIAVGTVQIGEVLRIGKPDDVASMQARVDNPIASVNAALLQRTYRPPTPIDRMLDYVGAMHLIGRPISAADLLTPNRPR